jgi:hypothetical protein
VRRRRSGPDFRLVRRPEGVADALFVVSDAEYRAEASIEPLTTRPGAGVDVTVVFPGGHGTVRDVNRDARARSTLAAAVAGDEGVALAVYHAVGVLALPAAATGSSPTGR